MQTKYIFPSLVLMFIVSTTSLLAVDPTSTPTPTIIPTTSPKPTNFRQEFREQRKELMEDFKENRKEVRTTIAQTRQVQRRARVQAVFNEMIKSLNLRLNSYLSFRAKIQARITQNSTTKDVSVAQTKLNELDAIVVTYNTHIVGLNTNLNEILLLDQPNTKLGDLKRASNSTRDDLKTMRRVLTDTIRLLIKAPAKP